MQAAGALSIKIGEHFNLHDSHVIGLLHCSTVHNSSPLLHRDTSSDLNTQTPGSINLSSLNQFELGSIIIYILDFSSLIT